VELIQLCSFIFSFGLISSFQTEASSSSDGLGDSERIVPVGSKCQH
jgi:hypothetical protein